MTIDPARVLRALALHVESLDDGSYLVTGGAEPHVVTGSLCDCADAFFNRAPCKHVVACHIHRRLDPRVVEALRAIGRALEELEIPSAKERMKEGGRVGGKGSGNLPEASERVGHGDVRDLVGSAVEGHWHELEQTHVL